MQFMIRILGYMSQVLYDRVDIQHRYLTLLY